MAMVNQTQSPVNAGMFNPNVKDSRWLTLEVCREFTRSKCTRTETECKFAHPPPHVEVQNGRVTCCFDSIKGKCQRKEPPCKYLHPPQHLKEQLLQNGRNNLIMKNLQMQALAVNLQPVMPGMMPTVMYEPSNNKPTMPYPQSMLPSTGQYPVVAHPYQLIQNSPGFNPYMSPSMAGVPAVMSSVETNGVSMTPVSAASVSAHSGAHVGAGGGLVPSAVGQQKVSRPDRLEQSSGASSVSSGNISNSWNGHGSHTDSIAPSSHYHPSSQLYFQPQVVEVLTGAGKKRPRDPSDDLVLGMNAMPGMIPMIKRTAMSDGKGGLPVYQPGMAANAYQQAALAMQLQQQQFAPVTIAGHPPGVPRF